MKADNQENIILLLKDLFHNGEGLVPFLGAGTSEILGLPKWEDLVRLYIKESGVRLDFDQEYNGWDNLPEIVDKVYSLQGDHGKYTAFLKNNLLMPHETQASELHYILTEHFPLKITTNFDNSFEKPARRLGLNYNSIIFPDVNLSAFSGRATAFLHGNLVSGDVIFRLTEYEQAYGNKNHPVIKNFLKEVIAKKSLLFIGFSFGDKRFREALQEAIFEVKEYHEKMSETYSKKFPSLSYKKPFVITKSKYLKTHLRDNEITSIEILADSRFKNLFEIKRINGMTEYHLKDGLSDALVQVLIKELKNDFPAKEVDKMVTSIWRNKINVDYFKKHDFSVVEYKEYRSEVELLIEKIVEKTVNDENNAFKP